jgi:hypothetical protein
MQVGQSPSSQQLLIEVNGHLSATETPQLEVAFIAFIDTDQVTQENLHGHSKTPVHKTVGMIPHVTTRKLPCLSDP